jgi:FAD/FMN-containing dehydrogenase
MRPSTKSSRWPWRFPAARTMPAPSFRRRRRQGYRSFRAARERVFRAEPSATASWLISRATTGNIFDLNLERRTVRVGAGVVLDQLNDFLRPHKLCFGPDVATSSRATLGGMIANDSSGAHTPVYGTTADHVSVLEILTSDGRVVRVGSGQDSLPRQRDLLESLTSLNELQITERFPPGLLKRWPGYALARAMREPGNLAHIIAGSEGTLAAIISAELKIVPLPEKRGVGLLFFASVAEAMQAAVELLDLKPAAIEHIDRLLLDQTRGQLEFQAARDLLELDTKPCEAILIVEFFEDVDERLALLKNANWVCARAFWKHRTKPNSSGRCARRDCRF